MKKNIAIVVLAVALVASLVQLGNQNWHAGAERAARRNVQLAVIGVWSHACDHAAAGSTARSKWCRWAASQTAISAAADGVSAADYQALALDQFAAKLAK